MKQSLSQYFGKYNLVIALSYATQWIYSGSLQWMIYSQYPFSWCLDKADNTLCTIFPLQKVMAALASGFGKAVENVCKETRSILICNLLDTIFV